MRIPPLLTIVTLFASTTIACAAEPDAGQDPDPVNKEHSAPTPAASDSPSSTPSAPDTTSPKKDDAPTTGCKAKTCESYSGACGDHDDGCGGKVSCGTCSPTACTPDAFEPNNGKATAKSLGAANDYDNTVLHADNASLADGDEDWFSATVTDGGFGGNPLITATVTADLEVSVFHVCASQPDYSYCSSGGAEDNTVGKGCRGGSITILQTECSGINESGTTYVRVRKRASDGICTGYGLQVKVE